MSLQTGVLNFALFTKLPSLHLPSLCLAVMAFAADVGHRPPQASRPRPNPLSRPRYSPKPLALAPPSRDARPRCLVTRHAARAVVDGRRLAVALLGRIALPQAAHPCPTRPPPHAQRHIRGRDPPSACPGARRRAMAPPPAATTALRVSTLSFPKSSTQNDHCLPTELPNPAATPFADGKPPPRHRAPAAADSPWSP